MPSVTQSESPALSSTSKKRRRDNDDEVQMPFSTAQFSHESQNLLSTIENKERLILPSNQHGQALATTASLPFHSNPRKVVPLAVSKRLRFLNENEEPSPSPAQLHHDHHAQQHHQSYFSHAHPTPPLSPQVYEAAYPRPNAPSRTNSSAQLLSPCHICHRKPTKKSDLDSFADCMGCSRRTCFVCIRACPGWLSSRATQVLGGRESYIHNDPSTTGEEDDELSTSFTMRDVDDDCNDDEDQDPAASTRRKGAERGWKGRGHREVICSGCCVERGSEGDVVCLGCLSSLEGA